MRFRDDENTAHLQSKIPFVLLGLGFFFCAIVARLFFLQVMNGEKYVKIATELFVREEEVVARRGNILDRHNKKLAETRPYFEIVITPQFVQNLDRTIYDLTRLFPITETEIRERLQKARYEPPFFPVVLMEDVPKEMAYKLREVLLPEYSLEAPYQLAGVSLRVTPLRQYLYPEVFSHALGYLKEIDQNQLLRKQKEQPGVYSRGDMIGAAGVEYSYDLQLKGTDGQKARVVDARGREMSMVEDTLVLQQKASFEPIAGDHLQTGLDFDAQMAAHEALAGRKGAVVAMDPKTGDVIVMYSSPGYDANRIMKKIDKKYWQHINLHEDKILFNRAVQAMYPPASTYKPIGIITGITSGKVHPETTSYSCGGGLRFGNRFFKCWSSGHGGVNCLKAMGQSCDVFFYQVGIAAGVDAFAEVAGHVGYGRLTGIDIPFEKSGLVPSKAWKKKRYGQDWIDSETLSVSIGQSYNLVTPVQMVKLAALIGNGGFEVTPHIGRRILNSDYSVKKSIPTQKTASPYVGTEALEWAQKGMVEVVHGYGTATRLRLSPNKIAGKTGTAQVIGHDSKAKRGRHTENHGLFIAYAPYDDPQIAVSVIVENGRSGSGAAAPVAQAVIDAYFGKQKSQEPKP